MNLKKKKEILAQVHQEPAQFRLAKKTWEQPKAPLIGQWQRMSYTDTVGY